MNSILTFQITSPSQVDGRNLINELLSNWESENISVLEIINKLPSFVLRIISREVLQLYGSYEIGSIYNIKNFYSMSVSKSLLFIRFICFTTYDKSIK